MLCRKRLSSPRCRSELIDSALLVIVHGQKMRTQCFRAFGDANTSGILRTPATFHHQLCCFVGINIFQGPPPPVPGKPPHAIVLNKFEMILVVIHADP